MMLGQYFKALRERRQETLREFAAKLGYNHTYLYQIENGIAQYPPSREFLEKVAQLLTLTQAESDELHRLARRWPRDIEEAVFEQPDAMSRIRAAIVLNAKPAMK